MLVSANINVNFIANSNVVHRICYRIGNAGPFTCIDTAVCGLGACSGSIPILVDNETCTVVQFEGYVQPACQPLNSNVDRVPLTATFVPVPSCKSYDVLCSNVPISPVVVIGNNGNGGYTGTVPSVIFTGGGGTGATGIAVVGTGAMILGSSDISQAGSGYANGVYSNVSVTGGAGTGAKVDVIVSGGVVSSLTLVNFGTGYANSETNLGIPALGGVSPTVAAIFIANSDKGNVNSITVTDKGDGYTSAPSVTISAYGGQQATATATLDDCAAFTNYGCLGSPVVIAKGSLSVGDNMTVCSNTGVINPGSNYTVGELAGNCLCNCVTATISASGPASKQIRYFYTRCNNVVVTGVLTVGASPAAIVDCIVPNSLAFLPIDAGVTGNISLGGPC